MHGRQLVDGTPTEAVLDALCRRLEVDNSGRDLHGALHVGPHSAGGSPGPACYGNGGQAATVTDAKYKVNIESATFNAGARTVSTNVSVLTSLFTATLGGPLVRAAALSYGLSKAIKARREKTGAGMMDAKKALEASNGDIEAAVDALRAKGLATAQKKSSRTAAEGLVGVGARDELHVVADL